MLTGLCLCGGVKYEVDGELSETIKRHCRFGRTMLTVLGNRLFRSAGMLHLSRFDG
jgi:hypothetical protein